MILVKCGHTNASRNIRMRTPPPPPLTINLKSIYQLLICFKGNTGITPLDKTLNRTFKINLLIDSVVIKNKTNLFKPPTHLWHIRATYPISHIMVNGCRCYVNRLIKVLSVFFLTYCLHRVNNIYKAIEAIDQTMLSTDYLNTWGHYSSIPVGSINKFSATP